MSTQLTGLAQKLVKEGLIEEEEATFAVTKASEQKVPLTTYLTENKLIDTKKVALMCSEDFGLPYFDLEAYSIDHIPQLKIKPELYERKHALPVFQRGKRLYVAVADPTNLQALDDIKFQSGTNPEPIIVEDDKLTKAIAKVISEKQMESMADLDEGLESLEITGDEELEAEDSGTDDTPIVRFVNKMLLDAINTGASDIHFEPYEKTYRVRFRQDGILHEHANPPANLSPRISSRIKVMSQLDISERRVPQDGRFKMKISKTRAIDFRVSTCPTLFGEKVVMRILDPTAATLGIDVLGYEPHQKELFMDAIHKPQGMVLVTGPTGSGKTVSLYTALNILNTTARNISTAEDPVEINLQGINQVNVNPKAGLTFAGALKSFLRQDPDIVMVGEIRDLETAEIAVKAAQTGHLVLSTLHTNSAPETLNRMINMGIPGYNLATSVLLVIAQRLARKLCEECKKEVEIPANAMADLGFDKTECVDTKVYEPVGCRQCNQGYKGRVGLYEVMPISETIADIIMGGGNAIDIANQAKKEGIWNLRQAGLNKVKNGLTSLEEVSRVTKD